jgi:hypothetical protein
MGTLILGQADSALLPHLMTDSAPKISHHKIPHQGVFP